ncbi:hypothetical protein [Thermogemmatispora sp.]|uniref:hypothetical protein n=1 Tax=Thermogemmatispora sp. TaxID=1968838 RepID=UPI001DE8EA9A|nr:hypothetical protein [Thermogemmatispora sp.]MBX5450820.1 hypothetical protein [Thermogemmatispora sp.]
MVRQKKAILVGEKYLNSRCDLSQTGGSMYNQDDTLDRMRNGEEDECNMCGGFGYLDPLKTQVCPDCQGTGRVSVYLPE